MPRLSLPIGKPLTKEHYSLFEDTLAGAIAGYFQDMTAGIDPYKEAINRISVEAGKFGSFEFYVEDSMFTATFSSKLQTIAFCDYLENNDDVYGYEINLLVENTEEEQDINLDDIVDEGNLTFEVDGYLESFLLADSPHYYDIEQEPEEYIDDGIVTEVIRRVKINALGQKRIKMQCQRGYKWNAERKCCVKMTAKESMNRHRAAKKAMLKKRAQGTSLRNKVNRATKKAMRFRKSRGL